jgi:hypothetical protein
MLDRFILLKYGSPVLCINAKVPENRDFDVLRTNKIRKEHFAGDTPSVYGQRRRSGKADTTSKLFYYEKKNYLSGMPAVIDGMRKCTIQKD